MLIRPTVKRLLLTVTVFVCCWGATAAAALWFGRVFWPVLLIGVVALLAVPTCLVFLGGRWVALPLAVLCGLPALISMADAIGDQVLLSRGVTVQARVVSVGYGKSGNQQDCSARDATTGHPIPGTLRDCLSDGVGDSITATVDPRAAVAPFDGARADVADDLATEGPLLEYSLAVQALVIAATGLWARGRERRRERRRERGAWPRPRTPLG